MGQELRGGGFVQRFSGAPGVDQYPPYTEQCLRLVRMFPAMEIDPAEVRQFNNETTAEIENIRNFIILHYKVNQRSDSKYWIDCREMAIPDSLAHKIALVRE